VRGAEGVVHENVAQGGHLARQLFVVLLLALVDAAVLQQHDLAGADVTPSTQLATSGTGAAQQLGQALATGASESSGLNSPSVGRPRWLVTITAAPASSAMRMQGTRGADAGVFGDVPASSCGTLRSARMKTRWPRALPWAHRSDLRAIGSRAVVRLGWQGCARGVVDEQADGHDAAAMATTMFSLRGRA
jgi:hypothetical protein